MTGDDSSRDDYGSPWVDLRLVTPASELVALMSREEALGLQAAPLEHYGGRLPAVYVDPANLDALDRLANRWFTVKKGDHVEWRHSHADEFARGSTGIGPYPIGHQFELDHCQNSACGTVSRTADSTSKKSSLGKLNMPATMLLGKLSRLFR
ncbi:MAG TPA: hypothetical protein DCY13_16780 [Verrucomicrobiales bacterium]|nr:hypothetical protein [Verrucomicrobiales bacterium]